MKRRKQKKVTQLEIIPQSLLKKVSKESRSSIETLIRVRSNLDQTNQLNGKTSDRLLNLIIQYAKNPNLPEIKLLQKIVDQIPHSNLN